VKQCSDGALNKDAVLVSPSTGAISKDSLCCLPAPDNFTRKVSVTVFDLFVLETKLGTMTVGIVFRSMAVDKLVCPRDQILYSHCWTKTVCDLFFSKHVGKVSYLLVKLSSVSVSGMFGSSCLMHALAAMARVSEDDEEDDLEACSMTQDVRMSTILHWLDLHINSVLLEKASFCWDCVMDHINVAGAIFCALAAGVAVW